jgi:hypothetical protein
LRSFQNIIFYCLIVLLSFNTKTTCKSQAVYSYIKFDTALNYYELIPCDKFIIDKYIAIINSLIKSDQNIRKYDPRNIGKVDTANYEKLNIFFSIYGIPTLNNINLKNDSLRFKIEFSRHTLFQHFSDYFHESIFKHYEISVLKKIANPYSLCNYTIQYLDRQTEFANKGNYFVIPLPNLRDDNFGIFYIKSIRDFIIHYFKIASNDEIKYLICKNPHKESLITFINDTKLINIKFKDEGLYYKNPFHELLFNYLNNYKKNEILLAKYTSEFILIIYSKPRKQTFSYGDLL